MKSKRASYTYTKSGLKLKIISDGVSKTNIRDFLRTIPAKHMSHLNLIFFIDKIPENWKGHSWEPVNTHKNYTAVYYRTQTDEMRIGVYIARHFLSEINKNRIWIKLIRQAILHEIAHHLIDLSGKNNMFNEREMEDLVDRYTERHSHTRVLMLKPPQIIQKYDMIWDEIERMA